VAAVEKGIEKKNKGRRDSQGGGIVDRKEAQMFKISKR
jgi:hypothetical protein